MAGILLAVVLPGLAAGRNRSEQVQCLNNLRLIAHGFHSWSADHGGIKPFRVPYYEGGTYPVTGFKSGVAWYEFAVVSNELATPKILVCPSDTATRKVARDFTLAADGGFLHVSYRNNALSYFLNLDCGTRNVSGSGGLLTQELTSNQALTGDRNLRVDSPNTSCSSRINNAASILTSRSGLPWGVSGWTNGIHDFSGNLALVDGIVRQTSVYDFRETMNNSDDNGAVHILMPR